MYLYRSHEPYQFCDLLSSLNPINHCSGNADSKVQVCNEAYQLYSLSDITQGTTRPYCV